MIFVSYISTFLFYNKEKPPSASLTNKSLGGATMHSYYISNLLNLEGVIVKNITHSDSYIKIFIETKAFEHTCPCCGNKTKRIHDYRNQSIKDLPFQLKDCYLILKKRRYSCSCGKKFYEKYNFLPKFFRRTSRMTAYIAKELHSSSTLKSIAERCNVSTATVNRILDTISYDRPRLHEAISIDEFKGNAETGKYQCILVDPIKHNVLDILPNRSQADLAAYFRQIPKDERYRVKYFSCDMWEPYVDLAQAFFPNATVVIDKYHFIRQMTWAIENVRKRLQKEMLPSLRKYYKRSKRLILARYENLSNENKRACELMLLYNEDLRRAHFLKEWFYKICSNPKFSEQRKDFSNWILNAESSGIPEFQKCAATYRRWSNGILNAFKYSHISNGPTEGFNNKIKVLKRISYGIRNFKHFRTRILLTTH